MFGGEAGNKWLGATSRCGVSIDHHIAYRFRCGRIHVRSVRLQGGVARTGADGVHQSAVSIERISDLEDACEHHGQQAQRSREFDERAARLRSSPHWINLTDCSVFVATLAAATVVEDSG